MNTYIIDPWSVLAGSLFKLSWNTFKLMHIVSLNAFCMIPEYTKWILNTLTVNPLCSVIDLLMACYDKSHRVLIFNTLRQRQNGRHFADDIFKCVFLNENIWTLLKISLKFVPNVRIKNIPALIQIMAWCWSGDKPLSERMMVRLLTYICVTRPQWVNEISIISTLELFKEHYYHSFATIFIPFNFILSRKFFLTRCHFRWDGIKLSTKCNVIAFYFHHPIHITNKVSAMGTFLLLVHV